jgi:hypothetical protein
MYLLRFVFFEILCLYHFLVYIYVFIQLYIERACTCSIKVYNVCNHVRVCY